MPVSWGALLLWWFPEKAADSALGGSVVAFPSQLRNKLVHPRLNVYYTTAEKANIF